MKTPHNPSAGSTTALVKELDDLALRSGHALLDSGRALEFSDWIDLQLQQLEVAFSTFCTPQSVRRSLGR
jgi:hypothetical protein